MVSDVINEKQVCLSVWYKLTDLHAACGHIQRKTREYVVHGQLLRLAETGPAVVYHTVSIVVFRSHFVHTTTENVEYKEGSKPFSQMELYWRRKRKRSLTFAATQYKHTTGKSMYSFQATSLSLSL